MNTFKVRTYLNYEMDDDKLIELVRQHREIYDMSDPRYIKTGHKTLIWKNIAEQLSRTPYSCKARWNNIRDNYRKSIRKFATTQTAKRYKYAAKLKFLDEALHTNDILHFNFSASQNCPSSLEEEDSVPLQSQSYEITENVTNSVPETNDQTGEIYTDRDDAAWLYERRKSPDDFLEHGADEADPPPQSGTISEYNFDAHFRFQQRCDGIDAFLAGIATTLKTLSPYKLNLAKRKIFTIVQDYEMEAIINDQKDAEQRQSESLKKSTRVENPSMMSCPLTDMVAAASIKLEMDD